MVGAFIMQKWRQIWDLLVAYFGAGMPLSTGLRAALLASMIATVLGYIGGAAIVGAVGSVSLGVIASAASNGVVNAKTYSRKTGKITNYKYIWSFTPSGSRKYGDYTSYVTV